MEKQPFAPSVESVARRETTPTLAFDRGDPTPTTTAHSVAVVYHDCFTFDSPSSLSALIAPTEGSRGLDDNPTARQPTTPLLSMIQRCDSYSNFYDALSDPRLSSSSSSAATRLLLLLQLQQRQHYQENASLPTDSSTIRTSSSTTERMIEQEQQQHRRRDVLLGYSLLIATSLATAVLNAAITIFGMGVGVGLILGDTMRDFPSTLRTTSTNTTATAATTTTATVPSLSSNNDEGEDVQVYPSTPTCRATVQRISNRPSQIVLPTIQQQPQHQRRSTMPAQ